jgi:hypothetical protein
MANALNEIYKDRMCNHRVFSEADYRRVMMAKYRNLRNIHPGHGMGWYQQHPEYVDLANAHPEPGVPFLTEAACIARVNPALQPAQPPQLPRQAGRKSKRNRKKKRNTRRYRN